MRRRLRRWRALCVLLWRAGRWRAVVVGILAITQGLLPTALILATGALVAAVPDAVRQGFDSPEGDRALVALGLLGAAFVGGAVLQTATSHWVRVLDNAYAQAVHDTVAKAALGPPGIARLEDPDVANELAALEEVERTDNFLSTVSNLRSVVQERATGIGAFIILLSFAWWAPFVLLAGWRVVVIMIGRLVEHGIELGFSAGAASEMRRSRYLRGLAVEAPAAKEIRVFGLASWVTVRYAENWLASMRRIWRNRFTEGIRTVGAVAAVGVAHTVVLAVLGWEASKGTISVAQVVVFVQAILATESLGWVGDPQWATSRALVVAGQVLDLERRLAGDRSLVKTPATAAETATGPVGVRLENVWFTYRGRHEPTLRGLDLTIPPGQSLAIVGENGAGKTTLIKLLCGLYEPGDGTIRVAGQTPQYARDRIGVIFQEFLRYELPLRANVGFGNLALTNDDDALRQALTDAGGADLLESMPAGWDTVLARGYEGSRDLSGGQWQKVALARALTAIRGGAGLLILDEPTANLDVRAETELFDRFLELTSQTTTILVSHRLASVRHADRIVVIADGRMVEDGTHDELRALGGRYDRMFTLQAQRFAAESATTGTGDGDA
ncbi:ABC transporter ATP-binding protein [Actinopolymorpha alba]|uniref:ABC transporter ATP-binding protein n=1 Tax=Actinopolymorpha alba TaxID=533267 RepID=UPI0003767BBB|nr:ABC transporter ATP-binding protein [Actinopolymorpha alba]